MTDEKLVKRIFKLYAAIHPNSYGRVRWVISQTIHDQLEAMQRKQVPPVDSMVSWWPVGTPKPSPSTSGVRLLGIPARIGGTEIQLEVLR